MAFTRDDLAGDSLKIGAEAGAKWLAQAFLNSWLGRALNTWRQEKIGEIPMAVRVPISIILRIAIDPSRRFTVWLARILGIDPAKVQRAVEEGLDEFVETILESSGIPKEDLQTPAQRKVAAEQFVKATNEMQFAVLQRNRMWYEVHALDCSCILNTGTRIVPGSTPDPASYIEGVKLKSLQWITDNLDVVTVPQCCERELPKAIRVLITPPATSVAPKEPPKVVDWRPLAFVLADMRLPADAPPASNARFYENLLRQAGEIDELQDVCENVRQSAIKPVWDVDMFTSVLTRAVGEVGKLSSSQPPPGTDPDTHRRNQVSERIKALEESMATHVAAVDSKTITAILARLVGQIKEMVSLQGLFWDLVRDDVTRFAAAAHTRAKEMREQTRLRREARYRRR